MILKCIDTILIDLQKKYNNNKIGRKWKKEEKKNNHIFNGIYNIYIRQYAEWIQEDQSFNLDIRRIFLRLMPKIQ